MPPSRNFSLRGVPTTTWITGSLPFRVGAGIFSRSVLNMALNVYVASMSAYGTDGLGRDPLVVRFLRGSRRLRPNCNSRVPT